MSVAVVVELRPMREVFDAVSAYLRANGDTSACYIGAEHLPENLDAGDRYVWCPGGDAPYGQELDDEAISAHCWGVAGPPAADADPDVYRDAAWIMRGNLALALRAVLQADVQFKRSGWYKPASDGLGRYGNVYVLNFTVAIPSPEYPAARFTPTAKIRGVSVELFATGPEVGEQLGASITLGDA